MMVRAAGWRILVASVVIAGMIGTSAWAKSLKCMERFKFQDLPLGAWVWDRHTEDAFRVYRDAGFNVMVDAFEVLAEHPWEGGLPGEPRFERLRTTLDLAEKYGLKVIIHTAIADTTPWGGVTLTGNIDSHPAHYVRPPELKWLHHQVGHHPALVGYLLNDNCGLHDYTKECAKWLRNNTPGMFPWMSTNPDPIGQAKVKEIMPIISTQIYVLRQAHVPEITRRLHFCNSLERDRVHTNTYDMAMWPIIWLSEVPSHQRFQVFTALAYGAQGIWYFAYTTRARTVEGNPNPVRWASAKQCNAYASYIGAHLLGHRSGGVFHTGEKPTGALTPGPGQVVEQMSENLLAGVLVPEDRLLSGNNTPDYLMVVDKRTAPYPPALQWAPIRKLLDEVAIPDEVAERAAKLLKEYEPGERMVRIKFGPTVQSVVAITPGNALGSSVARGSSRVRYLRLKAGEGVLLKLN